MAGKYFEEFAVGDRYESPWRYVAESDLRRFLDLTGLREPLFESWQFIEAHTDHDSWLVPGFLTMSFSLGLFSRSGWIEGTGFAFLGAEALDFEAPVLVGDEIRALVETAGTRPTSNDDYGLVTLDWETETQDGATAMTMTSAHLILRENHN